MFQDLVQRSKLKAMEVEREIDKKVTARKVMIKVVEDALPDIKELGFENVEFRTFKDDTTFTLRLQHMRGYEYMSYTFNMELNIRKEKIVYGYGANSEKGTEVEYDSEWNHSKLAYTMKHALRALVSKALTAMEVRNSRQKKGWN